LSEKPDHRYAIDFACFAVRPGDFLSKLGTFDENFVPAYFEDADMRYRMMLLGYDGIAVPDAKMLHKWSTTQNMDAPVCSHEQFRRNRAYYIEKWGGDHKHERFSRPYGDPSRDVNDWVVDGVDASVSPFAAGEA
jgi:GT2 family glycosyltransferase